MQSHEKVMEKFRHFVSEHKWEPWTIHSIYLFNGHDNNYSHFYMIKF